MKSRSRFSFFQSMSYIVVICILYFAMGIWFIIIATEPDSTYSSGLPRWSNLVFGVILCLYGGFRFYRALTKRKNPDV